MNFGNNFPIKIKSKFIVAGFYISEKHYNCKRKKVPKYKSKV